MRLLVPPNCFIMRSLALLLLISCVFRRTPLFLQQQLCPFLQVLLPCGMRLNLGLANHLHVLVVVQVRGVGQDSFCTKLQRKCGLLPKCRVALLCPSLLLNFVGKAQLLRVEQSSRDCSDLSQGAPPREDKGLWAYERPCQCVALPCERQELAGTGGTFSPYIHSKF